MLVPAIHTPAAGEAETAEVIRHALTPGRPARRRHRWNCRLPAPGDRGVRDTAGAPVRDPPPCTLRTVAPAVLCVQLRVFMITGLRRWGRQTNPKPAASARRPCQWSGQIAMITSG